MKKWRFHELDAFHLNVGVPIVITLFLLLVNFEIFALYFVEKISIIFKFYLYIILFILIVSLILTKQQKSTKKVLKLSLYEFGVFSSLTILFFLLINFTCSEEIYRSKHSVNYQLLNELETIDIKQAYLKTLKLTPNEIDKYYKNGYNIHIQINKSCFGYEFLKSRTFEKTL